MADDLDWSRSALSLAVLSFMLVSALAAPIAGRLADRYSLKGIMAAGVLAAAVGIGLTGTVTAPWQALALYGVVFGLGNAASSNIAVGVMISRWFPHRTGLANSVAISGTAVGQLLIIGVLASFLSYLGWRSAFGLLGAASLLVLLPLVLAVVRSRPPPPQPSSASTAQVESRVLPTAARRTGSVLRSRDLWLLVGIYAICGFQDFLVVTHLVAFAGDRGVGQVLAGNILALMGLMGLLGVIASGLLADKYGAGRPTVLCFLMRIAIFAQIIYFQSTLGIVTFALAYGFTFLITAPLTLVFARNIFGMDRIGTVSGLILMVHQVSGGLGAYVGAVIFDRWGSYDGALVLMLGLAILATITTLQVRERPVAGRLPG